MSDADSSKYSTSNLAPILAWSIFFCAVWGVLGLLYLACLARWRQWTFSILILLCIAGEIAGYVARIFWYTLRNGAPNNAYLAQIGEWRRAWRPLTRSHPYSQPVVHVGRAVYL